MLPTATPTLPASEALATIAKSQPTGTIFGFPFFKLRFQKVDIQEPDKAYYASRSEALANLDRTVSDGTNAYEILSTYANLESLAEATRCYYLDKPNEITFVREQIHLEVEQIPWTTVVALTP